MVGLEKPQISLTN